MKLRWKSVLKWSLVLAGLLLAARAMEHFPWHRLWDALASADPGWIAVSALLTLASLLAKGWGWHLVMTGGSSRRLATSQRAHMLGVAASALTVSVGAEVVRVTAVVRWLDVGVRRAATAAAWSRIAEGCTLLILLLPASLLAMPERLGRLRLAAAGLAVLALVVVALLLRPEYRQRLLLPLLMRRFPARWRDRLRQIAAVGSGPHMLGPLSLAMLNWLLQWGAYDTAMRSVGIHAPAAASLAVMVGVNLGGLLRLTPGNIGVLQAGSVVILGLFGVAAADALAAGLILQGVMTIPPALVGVALVGSPRKAWRSWSVGRHAAEEEGAASAG